MSDLLHAIASPDTCLTTALAIHAVQWLNSWQADLSVPAFMWTWDVFQAQYYAMPRRAGERIEGADTLGRKCWAFAYLTQTYEPAPLVHAYVHATGSACACASPFMHMHNTYYRYEPAPLARALAAAHLSLANFTSQYEAAIEPSTRRCQRVMANCFVNASYNPARAGSCPIKVALFRYAGFERENLKRGLPLQYPF